MTTVDQPAPRKGRRLRLLIPKVLFWPVIVFALVSQSIYQDGGFWDTTLEVVSFIILLIAAMGRVWVSAYISGRKDNQLVTDGPYSVSRNPLYFFSCLGFIGAGLAFEKISVAVCFAIAFFLTHWPTIYAEEAKLRGWYGQEFDDYAKRVPRFIPKISNLSIPEYVTFRPSAFNPAVLDCGLVMAVFILAHLIEYGQNAGAIPILIKNVP